MEVVQLGTSLQVALVIQMTISNQLENIYLSKNKICSKTRLVMNKIF